MLGILWVGGRHHHKGLYTCIRLWIKIKADNFVARVAYGSLFGAVILKLHFGEQKQVRFRQILLNVTCLFFSLSLLACMTK